MYFPLLRIAIGVIVLAMLLLLISAAHVDQEPVLISESVPPALNSHAPVETHASGGTREGPGESHEGHGKGHEGAEEETPPETFVVLDLFSEALEASFAGVGVKFAELKPKVEGVNQMYHNGEKHKALAKALGISTEVVLLGFFVEALGIGEMFISALSFSNDWLLLFAQSTVGILASTKVALIAGEKVEEAVEERYEEDVIAESGAKPTHGAHTSGAHHTASH
ncbi:conserved hypothetical protein [Gammaproteobacteria bacterium]